MCAAIVIFLIFSQTTALNGEWEKILGYQLIFAISCIFYPLPVYSQRENNGMWENWKEEMMALGLPSFPDGEADSASRGENNQSSPVVVKYLPTPAPLMMYPPLQAVRN